MKRIGKLFDKIYSEANIRTAIVISSKGKKHRQSVQAVLSDIDSHIPKIKNMLENGTYQPCKVHERIIKEGANQKERKITTIKYFPDQIIHWCLILVLKPFIEKSSYKLSCGSMPGRGGHYGKRFVFRWLQNDYKNTKYCAKLDVRHFYPSIDHDLMYLALSRRFKDKRLLSLCKQIIEHYPQGLPIGFLTSQWFSNFFLQSLDYFIKQTLGIKYYVRYMDDMVMFGPNKRKLRNKVLRIMEFVKNLRLQIKDNWQVFRTDSRPLDFLGFRFYRNRVVMRKSLMLRATKSAKRVKYKYNPTETESRRLMSYLGWFRHTNSHAILQKRIKPYVDIHCAKLCISIADRRRSRLQKEKQLC